jgi:hypothetical protein
MHSCEVGDLWNSSTETESLCDGIASLACTTLFLLQLFRCPPPPLLFLALSAAAAAPDAPPAALDAPPACNVDLYVRAEKEGGRLVVRDEPVPFSTVRDAGLRVCGPARRGPPAPRSDLVLRPPPPPPPQGTIATYTELAPGDGCGAPLAVGSDLALPLADLPAADATNSQPALGCGAAGAPVCRMPAERAAATFPLGGNATLAGLAYMGLSWNPKGHGPGAIYASPHFVRASSRLLDRSVDWTSN